MIRGESRTRYLEIISRLADRGAPGVVAGCTEIELLVTGDDAGLPYFPTTRLHAEAIGELAHAGALGGCARALLEAVDDTASRAG